MRTAPSMAPAPHVVYPRKVFQRVAPQQVVVGEEEELHVEVVLVAEGNQTTMWPCDVTSKGNRIILKCGEMGL
ncbi:hypothetical protein CesoFtcFv8_010173 [Champsocephalus esox]|uniref:Uncharacterized protein n=1 Tax=Champsocephalus esox TaxID=159716 RepID=A0AAN8C7I5_9TELE|nr:hypothetical protein CesoFtcFv8_010173 [Champsocephalus esox]